MAVLYINNIEIPAPSELEVRLFDIGSAEERNARGDAVIDRISVKRRLALKWALLSPDKLEALMRLVEGDLFEATYPDPALGIQRTMTCRCGEKSARLLRMRGGEPVWTEIEMEWIER